MRVGTVKPLKHFHSIGNSQGSSHSCSLLLDDSCFFFFTQKDLEEEIEFDLSWSS